MLWDKFPSKAQALETESSDFGIADALQGVVGWAEKGVWEEIRVG